MNLHPPIGLDDFAPPNHSSFLPAVMANREASQEQRWQAFAWVCHLVGDLHQPLHAGFGDDRGGNDIEVVFNGETINLHEFWDLKLIQQQAGSWQYLVGDLSVFPPVPAGSDWSPGMVDDWTNESHNLVRTIVYPAPGRIDETYTRKSWELIQTQLSLAAKRLATIINHQLKPQEPAKRSETSGNSAE